eukprot:Nk52_evm21s242 gene=Nk52_evmTU21s242
MSDRQFFVGGNWKLNGSTAKAGELVKMLNGVDNTESKTQVVVSPPALYCAHVRANLREDFHVAVQNVNHKPSGAFTGENSVAMAEDLGLNWIILGHSERRDIFKESDALISEKITACLAQSPKINVIACIGEHLEERKAGKVAEVIHSQLGPMVEALKSNKQDWDRIVIAYEPVWAIGTGVVASPEEAQDAHVVVRDFIRDRVGEDVAEKVRVIYGGSVNGANCVELAKKPDIDGFLVGGASLKDEFAKIIRARIES